ncbi:MAG: ERCC4 domain-containing protein [Methanobacteriota archaeon]
MKIFIDVTEPGLIFHTLCTRAKESDIEVRRTILHKRPGQGGSLRKDHPFYGLGADFVIAGDDGVELAGIERKTLEDLARSVSLDGKASGEPRLFRQLKDLLHHPTPILIIEGRPSFLYRRLEPAILGLQFWCAREGLAIIFSTSALATATGVYLIARKLADEFEGYAVPARPTDAPPVHDDSSTKAQTENTGPPPPMEDMGPIGGLGTGSAPER